MAPIDPSATLYKACSCTNKYIVNRHQRLGDTRMDQDIVELVEIRNVIEDADLDDLPLMIDLPL